MVLLGIWRDGQRQRSPRESDREGVKVTDVSRREASEGEGGLARVSVGPLSFAPILSGFEVVVDRPEQGRPLEALLGAMIAAMAGAEAEVPPEPLGGGAPEALVVATAVDVGSLKVRRYQLGERLPELVRGQASQRGLASVAASYPLRTRSISVRRVCLATRRAAAPVSSVAATAVATVAASTPFRPRHRWNTHRW